MSLHAPKILTQTLANHFSPVQETAFVMSKSSSGQFMKWASAKLKFDLEEQDAMLWLSVLESIPSQWKRKVKSQDMKIVDDLSAGPS